MAYEQVLFEVAHGVATITLNRPDRLNAWTSQMETELRDALSLASADDGVRAVILTGAGRGFCAGADMSVLSNVAQSGASIRDAVAADQRKHAWLLSVPKPLIAAINGPAVGLGFVIPLYCDFRIASTEANFSVIFSRRGLIAEYGLAWALPRIVGLPNAIDLAFTSKKIDASEALRIGLVTQVLPADDFLAAVQAFARELARSVSPRSLRVMKKQLWSGQSQTLDEAADMAFEEMTLSLQCDDFKEGVAHFLEKRAPKFTGR